MSYSINRKRLDERVCAERTQSGRLSDQLREAFERSGYLLTEKIVSPGIVEVYPHPASVELARAQDGEILAQAKCLFRSFE
jgi:hypothetical protein